MTRWCSTPSAPEATQAYVSAKVPTMILCETRGLQLFWVVRGGIGLNRRLGAEFQHSERLITYSILSLEPERRKNRRANTGHETLGIFLGFSSQRSSCLRFQMFCVETSSLLPKYYCNGCNLACKR